MMRKQEDKANDRRYLISILDRMRVIAVQAANLLMNSTDRTYLDTEFQLLVDEIDCVGCTGYWAMRLHRSRAAPLPTH